MSEDPRLATAMYLERELAHSHETEPEQVWVALTAMQAHTIVDGLRAAVRDSKLIELIEQVMADEPEFASIRIAQLFAARDAG